MTATNENDKVELTGKAMPEGTASPIDSPVVAPARRRLVLRGAAAAVPAILTLHSGSAVAARSSFLISGSTNVGADGKYRCLDLTNAVQDTTNRNLYDLGDDGQHSLTLIDGKAEYYADSELTQRVYPEAMCRDGGTYYKKLADGSSQEFVASDLTGKSGMVRQSSAVESGFLPESTTQPPTVEVQGRGMLISATARSSFAGRLLFKES